MPLRLLVLSLCNAHVRCYPPVPPRAYSGCSHYRYTSRSELQSTQLYRAYEVYTQKLDYTYSTLSHDPDNTKCNSG